MENAEKIGWWRRFVERLLWAFPEWLLVKIGVLQNEPNPARHPPKESLPDQKSRLRR